MQQLDLSGKKAKEVLEAQVQEVHKPALDTEERIVFAIAGPVIVMDPAWEVPKNLCAYVQLQRLAQNRELLQGSEDGCATDAECLIYLNNASLRAPMCSEWARIYEYLFIQYCKFMRIEPPAEFQEFGLNEYEEHLLKELKTWIHDKAVKAFKEKLRKNKKENANQCISEE